MSFTTTVLATDPVAHLHLVASSVDHLANGGIVINPLTPPEAEKWLRIPGLLRWGVMVVGVTAMIAAAGVMAVEKFTDHSVGNRGMKIAAWAMGGGILATTASGLYSFIVA